MLLKLIWSKYLWVYAVFSFCKQTTEINVYQTSIYQKHLFMTKMEMMQALSTYVANKVNRICNAYMRCPIIQSLRHDRCLCKPEE